MRFTIVRFIDANVLLYAVSTDADEQKKAGRANAILAERDLGLSVQVLQEFYVQATRATREDPLTHDQAARLVAAFCRFRVADVTIQVMRAAMSARERFGISYWNAAIIEAARSLGCETVLSEDLDHGQDYGGVRVENPFG